MNIGQDYLAYVTPVFIIFLIAYIFFCGYSFWTQGTKNMFKYLKGKTITIKRKPFRKLMFMFSWRIASIFFLIMMYFVAYSSTYKPFEPKISIHMQTLSETFGEQRTKTQITTDGQKTTDTTGYLKQVGESIVDSEAEAARQKYLNTKE